MLLYSPVKLELNSGKIYGQNFFYGIVRSTPFPKQHIQNRLKSDWCFVSNIPISPPKTGFLPTTFPNFVPKRDREKKSHQKMQLVFIIKKVMTYFF